MVSNSLMPLEQRMRYAPRATSAGATLVLLATPIRPDTSVADAEGRVEACSIATRVGSYTADAVGINSFPIQAWLALLFMNVQIFGSMRYSAQACDQIEPRRNKENCIDEMRARLGSGWPEKGGLRSQLSKTMAGFGT